MSNARHKLAITLATCLSRELLGADFEVSGQQELQVVLNSATSSVVTTTFTLTCVGTNWAMSTVYTNSGMRECIAMVDGRAYSSLWNLAGAGWGGLVMDRPSDRLDGSPEFVRVLVGAFLTSRDRPASVTNHPVGFLFPRHPGLYCYRSDIVWSPESPFFPERIRFRLDEGLCRRVSNEAISYFFRSGYRDRSLFRRWQETQKSGAEYSVSAWTNWGGLTLPQRARLTHSHFEHSGGGESFPRVFLITVTNVQRPASAALVPALMPGSSVQEVAGGICYLYTSPDGKFLPVGQAKSVGRVLTKRANPRWVTAITWVWSLPWGHFLWLVAVSVVLIGAGVLVILGWRMFVSRK